MAESSVITSYDILIFSPFDFLFIGKQEKSIFLNWKSPNWLKMWLSTDRRCRVHKKSLPPSYD